MLSVFLRQPVHFVFLKRCRLTESDIAKSLAVHLSPFLFPSQDGPGPREDLYGAFGKLLAAQVELNSFISRSADAFSYDNSIAFVLEGDHLGIVKRDPSERTTWVRNGERLARLHYYWYYRAVDTVATSELAGTVIGQLGNHEANSVPTSRRCVRTCN